MYTTKNFEQDYGLPVPGEPYWLSWEKDYIEELLEEKTKEFEEKSKEGVSAIGFPSLVG